MRIKGWRVPPSLCICVWVFVCLSVWVCVCVCVCVFVFVCFQDKFKEGRGRRGLSKKCVKMSYLKYKQYFNNTCVHCFYRSEDDSIELIQIFKWCCSLTSYFNVNKESFVFVLQQLIYWMCPRVVKKVIEFLEKKLDMKANKAEEKNTINC